MSTHRMLLLLALAVAGSLLYLMTTTTARDSAEKDLLTTDHKTADLGKPPVFQKADRAAVPAISANSPNSVGAVISVESTKHWNGQADAAELIVALAGLEEAQKSGHPLEPQTKKARDAINRYTAGEFAARRTAGLYDVLQIHIADVPLKVRPSTSVLEAFTAEDGQWKRVQLPPDEYPDLYALLKVVSEVEDKLEENQ